MQSFRRGRYSFVPQEPPVIEAWASAAGKKEARGPLQGTFDLTCDDAMWGEKTWEQAEAKMQKAVLAKVLEKAQLRREDIDMVFSGDLLNQCIGSSFPLRNTGLPHIGLYGACSTMAEGLLLAAMAVGGGYAHRAVAMTSSHFAASERQYRFPLGYGGQRTPTAQWTVTGAGAVILCGNTQGIRVTGCTVGTVTDLGVKDACNMGAAMAPAAFATVKHYFEDFGCGPEAFDAVITGDLGHIGSALFMELCRHENIRFDGKLRDCGAMIFKKEQDVHAGGSGCGCSAVTLCGEILGKMQAGIWKRVLLCGTGALLSPTSTQQGLPIPGVCHAVCLEA